jgi:hypothetical protein
MYMFRNGASSSTKEGPVFLCRRYVCYTTVSARVYPRCHSVQVTMDSVALCHCTTLSNIYTKVSCQCRLVQQFMPYVTTPTLQLVSLTVVGLTAAKFKPLTLPVPAFSSSNTTYIWICMVILRIISPRTDRTGNTTSNCCSMVACASVAMLTWRFLGHCPVTGVVAVLFPSKWSLCCLHNPGFQQTFHSMRLCVCLWYVQAQWLRTETQKSPDFVQNCIPYVSRNKERFLSVNSIIRMTFQVRWRVNSFQ